MKVIELIQGKVTRVDDEDYERVSAMKWCAHVRQRDGRVYAVRTQRMRLPNGKWKQFTMLMHRFIMNAADHEQVDHEDGDGLNNQRCSNLRIATHTENGRNQKLSKANTTGYKGVQREKRPGRKPFKASIKVDQQPVHLGCYDTAVEAAIAYNAGAVKYHGEFANLNIIPA